MIVGCKCALYDKNFFVFEGGHKAQLEYDSGGGKEPTCIYAQGKHNIEIDGDPVICWPKTWPIDQNIFIIVVVVCWGGQRCKEVCKGVVTPSWLVKSVPGINQF